jgi:hypothetical protein
MICFRREGHQNPASPAISRGPGCQRSIHHLRSNNINVTASYVNRGIEEIGSISTVGRKLCDLGFLVEAHHAQLKSDPGVSDNK